MITQNMNKCLIRDSLEIRTALNKRLRQFDITGREIVELAKENGYKFTEQQLSRYRKHGNVKGSLQSGDILWICNAFKIELKLKVTNRRFAKKMIK